MSDTSITTADDKLCSGCGFPLGGSRLGIIGVPGTYHAHCLPRASTAALLTTARAEARKAALEEAAAVFDVYASDQRAAIAKGWLRGRGIKDSEVRAETWEDAAKELRDAAADPAIRALIEKEG